APGPAPAAAQTAAPSTAPTEGEYLYNVTLLRAAPGHFNDLMDALEAAAAVHRDAGDEAPFWIRHSQGDHWDFMLIHPMASWEAHFAGERVRRRAAAWEGEAGRRVRARLETYTAYREEWFARSVPLEALRRRFEGMGMFHVEMFAGLPGRRAELVEQRRMENRYYAVLERQQNLIFVREAGPDWDAMTIGFFPSLQAFAAAGAATSEADQEAAARVAGFAGVNDIGPYLRSLLSYHHDTLALRVQR
ncbi:MAG: hypothetical protein RQ751_10925, partial [Longimicrobiales bacterium]|nr:hypothetical protein [Longimicrobiales bacterium]